jgi:hypothetical protein
MPVAGGTPLTLFSKESSLEVQLITIVVEADFVYWTGYYRDSDESCVSVVMQIPIGGGCPRTLVLTHNPSEAGGGGECEFDDGAYYSVAVDATANIYWGADALYRLTPPP